MDHAPVSLVKTRKCRGIPAQGRADELPSSSACPAPNRAITVVSLITGTSAARSAVNCTEPEDVGHSGVLTKGCVQ